MPGMRLKSTSPFGLYGPISDWIQLAWAAKLFEPESGAQVAAATGATMTEDRKPALEFTSKGAQVATQVAMGHEDDAFATFSPRLDAAEPETSTGWAPRREPEEARPRAGRASCPYGLGPAGLHVDAHATRTLMTWS